MPTLKRHCLTLKHSDGFHEGIKQMAFPLRMVVGGMLSLFGLPPKTAAASSVFAATAEDPDKLKGKFICRSRFTGKCGVEAWVEPMVDEAPAKELWATTEAIVKEKLPSVTSS